MDGYIPKEVVLNIVGQNSWAGSRISKLHTVDAVPVVRCKDCKYRLHNIDKWGNDVYKCEVEIDLCDPYEVGRKPHEDDWFCADGKREEEK